jgi:hypothetical protein
VNTPAKVSLTFTATLFAGALKAFVLMLMWNWFVTPVFHIESVSFWQVLGLLWVVQLFVGNTMEKEAETWRWESLFLVLDVCVPEHRAEELREKLNEKNEGIWSRVGIQIFEQLTGYGFTLALGWLVHTFFITV